MKGSLTIKSFLSRDGLLIDMFAQWLSAVAAVGYITLAHWQSLLKYDQFWVKDNVYPEIFKSFFINNNMSKISWRAVYNVRLNRQIPLARFA